MKVTNKMMISSTVSNIQSNLEKMDKINQNLTTGKKIQKPQDDPVGTTRAMGYRGDLSGIDQHLRNVDQVNIMLSSTDVSLGQATNILHRVTELAVQGANGNLEQDSRDAIADEITQIIDEMSDIGNTNIGGKYIFGGYKTTEPPFKKYIGSKDAVVNGPGADLIDINGNVRTGINANNVTVVKYNGDDGRMKNIIGENVTVESNITGSKVFMDGINVFQTLIDLRDSLYQGDITDKNNDGKSVENSIGLLDNILEKFNIARAEVGSKMQRMDETGNKLKTLQISVSDLLSKVEDTDVSKTIMELKVQESVQRMALAVGAKVIQPTLMDFLR